jgi:MFS family permease
MLPIASTQYVIALESSATIGQVFAQGSSRYFTRFAASLSASFSNAFSVARSRVCPRAFARLPQIVKGYKFSDLEVSLVVAVPYLFASAAMIIWAWHIDRTGKKVANLAVACFLGAVGLVASVLLTGSLLVALAGLTIWWSMSKLPRRSD